MATKIANDVLESYLLCKFKGYLKLAEQQGMECDFEAMLTELRADVRLKAIDAILTRYPGDQVARNTKSGRANLVRPQSGRLDRGCISSTRATVCPPCSSVHFLSPTTEPG